MTTSPAWRNSGSSDTRPESMISSASALDRCCVPSDPIGSLTNVSGEVFFHADDGVDGTELWMVAATADLSVTKTDSPDPVIAGDAVTYTVTVTNDGPSDASGVAFSDTLPAGVTFVSAVSTAGTCSDDGGTVFCNSIGTLANGASATVTIVVKVPSSTADADVLSNSATASATETDPDTGNNTNVTQNTTVHRLADLSVTKKTATSGYAPGHPLTYTVTVTNNGPNDAMGVVLSDSLRRGDIRLNHAGVPYMH